jgi:hypothetical protein
VGAPPNPLSLSLAARQARARELSRHDHQLIEVLEPEQHLPGLLEHLGTARQVILDEAQRHWPKQSWESTSTGGAPREGDLHVKVASVISDDPARDDGGSFICPVGVALRVGLSAVRVNREGEDDVTGFGPEAALYVPLALAPAVVAALQEQIAYWASNPPPSADEVAR